MSMKRVYRLTDLCCASCAAEIERDVNKIEEVASCTINFIMQKMTLVYIEGADVSSVEQAVIKAVRRVEPDCEVLLSK